MEVELAPHNPDWQAAFRKEADAIASLFPNEQIHIHHIGSTAISGIWAKPIIDILGVVHSLADFDLISPKLANLNYQAMGDFGIPGRRYFRKFGENSKPTHHFHIFQNESLHVERHLAFRNYLNQHLSVAVAYSDMKRELLKNSNITLEAYQIGKDPFIKRIESEAITWYRLRTL